MNEIKESDASNDFQRRACFYEDKSRWVTDPSINNVPYTFLESRATLGDMLDAGGGTGYLSSFLTNRLPASSVTIVDASKNMLALAREKMPYVNLINSTIESFSRANDRKYDTIIARQIFHYVQDENEVVRLLKNQLKNNGLFYVGQFVVTDDDSNEWHANLIRRISVNRKRSFTLDAFQNLFKSNGFRILKCSMSNYEENIKDFYSRRMNPELDYESLLSGARKTLNDQVSKSLFIKLEDDNLFFTVQFCHLLLAHQH